MWRAILGPHTHTPTHTHTYSMSNGCTFNKGWNPSSRLFSIGFLLFKSIWDDVKKPEWDPMNRVDQQCEFIWQWWRLAGVHRVVRTPGKPGILLKFHFPIWLRYCNILLIAYMNSTLFAFFNLATSRRTSTYPTADSWGFWRDLRGVSNGLGGETITFKLMSNSFVILCEYLSRIIIIIEDNETEMCEYDKIHYRRKEVGYNIGRLEL